MATPPKMAAPPIRAKRASCWRCSSICAASSRVGARINARVTPRGRPMSALRIGNMNAAVFPLPVIAHAKTSRPSHAGGMAAFWIAVGTMKPSASRPRRSSGWRVNDVNDMEPVLVGSGGTRSIFRGW
jgi:hypothetical protein